MARCRQLKLDQYGYYLPLDGLRGERVWNAPAIQSISAGAIVTSAAIVASGAIAAAAAAIAAAGTVAIGIVGRPPTSLDLSQKGLTELSAIVIAEFLELNRSLTSLKFALSTFHG